MMFLPRCNPLHLPGPMTMAGTAMGGMAVLAGIGPFLAGIGIGAGIVGGAVLARKAMKRRTGWQDEPDAPTADDIMPDAGVTSADPI